MFMDSRVKRTLKNIKYILTQTSNHLGFLTSSRRHNPVTSSTKDQFTSIRDIGKDTQIDLFQFDCYDFKQNRMAAWKTTKVMVIDELADWPMSQATLRQIITIQWIIA